MTDSEQTQQPDIVCPHCGGPIYGDLIAKAKERSRVSFKMSPKDGERLSLKNVGGMLVQMEKLLVACGKDIGVKTIVTVDDVTCTDGEIEVHMLLARQAKEPLSTSE